MFIYLICRWEFDTDMSISLKITNTLVSPSEVYRPVKGRRFWTGDGAGIFRGKDRRTFAGKFEGFHCCIL